MKKCLPVILMLCVCMLLVTSAFAEKTVYQDGVSPELVPVSDTQGGEAAALICDADGHVIASIPVGKMMTICVGERANVQDTEIAAALEKGLLSLLEDAHHSRGLWTVDTDLFYVQLPEEYAASLAEGGASVVMVFNPHILNGSDKLQALYSVDGQTWTEVTDVSFAGDGTVRLSIQQSGLLAFVVEHSAAFSKLSADSTIQLPAQIVHAANSNIPPSVVGKLAPEVVAFAQNGAACVATILNSDKEAVSTVPNGTWMIVTPLSERWYNPDVITYEHLQWAYDSICSAANIGALPAAGQDGTLGEAIDHVLAASKAGLSYADLAISDLFEVSLYADYLQQLKADPNNMLEITLDGKLNPDDTLIVLCASGVDGWHVVEEENVIVNQDGTVTLRLKHTGVLAFLVERPAAIDTSAADIVTAP